MDITNNINMINKSLIALNKIGYDVNKYLCSLAWQTSQLEYYYCHIVNNGYDSYLLHNRPKVHQLAYFNIGRGLPKELMDGHWCYVLKDLGSKMIIIPVVSIKDVPLNSKYEMDIEVEFLKKSRLQLSDIRTVDVQRVYEKKGYINVITPAHDIRSKVKNFILESN